MMVSSNDRAIKWTWVGVWCCGVSLVVWEAV